MKDDPERLQARAMLVLLVVTILFSGFLLWRQIGSAVAANLWNVRFIQAAARGAELPAPIPELNWWQYAWLGRAELTRSNLAAARIALDSLKNNSDPQAVAVLGKLAAAEGDHSRAVEIWSAQGNYQALVQAAEQAEQAGDFPLSEKYYLAAYRLAPAENILSLSSLYIDRLNQPEKAIPLLEETLLAFPAHERWPVWQRTMGDACRRSQDWICAEAAYQKALSIAPDDVLSLVGLGYIARDDKGDMQTALDFFSQAVERQPDQYEGYLALADTFSAQGEWQKADPAYLQAISARPDLVGLYIARAKGAAKSGDIHLARQTFAEARDRFPASDIAYYESAALEYQAGDLAAAAELIQQALSRMQPPQPWYYRLAGIIEMGQKDYLAAREILSSGLKRFPQETSLYIELALVEKELNHPEPAVQAIEKALAGDSPAAYLARAGVIYEWLGDAPRAIDYYRQALQRDPTDPVALPGLQRLEGQ